MTSQSIGYFRDNIWIENQNPCKINGYRRWRTVTGTKMGTFVKKNKLNNSSKWFTIGQKIRP